MGAARGDVVRLLQREANVNAGVVIFRSMTTATATARTSQVVTSCNKGARVCSSPTASGGSKRL